MTIMMKGSAKTLEGLRKSKKNVRTIGVPAETRTGHLRNTRQKLVLQLGTTNATVYDAKWKSVATNFNIFCYERESRALGFSAEIRCGHLRSKKRGNPNVKQVKEVTKFQSLVTGHTNVI
jgi:hypothetical protein